MSRPSRSSRCAVAVASLVAVALPAAARAQRATATTATAYPPGPSSTSTAFPPGPSRTSTAALLGGQMPKTFYACYIPSSGVVYRIKEVDLKQTCASAEHVPFSWSDGVAGAQGPQGVPGPQGPQGAPGTPGFSQVFTVVSDEASLAANTEASLSADCPAGSVLVGGGHWYTSLNSAAPPILLLSSPDGAGTGWAVHVTNFVPNAGAVKVKAVARCAK